MQALLKETVANIFIYPCEIIEIQTDSHQNKAAQENPREPDIKAFRGGKTSLEKYEKAK